MGLLFGVYTVMSFGCVVRWLVVVDFVWRFGLLGDGFCLLRFVGLLLLWFGDFVCLLFGWVVKFCYLWLGLNCDCLL